MEQWREDYGHLGNGEPDETVWRARIDASDDAGLLAVRQDLPTSLVHVKAAIRLIGCVLVVPNEQQPDGRGPCSLYSEVVLWVMVKVLLVWNLFRQVTVHCLPGSEPRRAP